MPEFHLDTAGPVDHVMIDGCTETGLSLDFDDLDGVTRGYIEAAFFTETCADYTSEQWDSPEARTLREEGQVAGELPCDVGFGDIAPESLAAVIADCAAFQASAEWKAFVDWRDDENSPHTSPADDEQAGRDLWFTRNGHGVGFWDRPESYYGPHQTPLDDLARKFGNVDACFGDDGKAYLS